VSELKGQGDAAVDWMLRKHESEKKAKKILKLKELASKYSVTLATFVTAVTINRPGVTTAIFGSKKIDHFKEIVAGGSLNIEMSDMKLVDEIVKDEVR
jgi:aryl-alcohol dehydrogenase-like predicted oxidoreductase